ncbi:MULTISPECIES: tyrosine-type recombinase/integrase [Gordonibacter]|uniref:Site-specific integrase n=1 Tax=Gordonibacter faecis TaxID=3047475 RepID=A0ABT7DIH8_9ACTN|nr:MULTISPECIES: site-specific integrase [unclassified Gordonibacter]MDJ1649330.1 site-specific integrase [Gordonibacter sp. KGMB12511]HIW75204.1 site-specific integrase [Candidatus Gordonibacter avicola]
MEESAREATPRSLVERFRRECGLPKRTAKNYSAGAAGFAAYLEETGRGIADISYDVLEEYRRQVGYRYTKATLDAYMVGCRAFAEWLALGGMIAISTVVDIRRRAKCFKRKIDLGPGAIEPELVERFSLTYDTLTEGSKGSVRTDVNYLSRYLAKRKTTLDAADAVVLDEFVDWLLDTHSEHVARKAVSNVKRFYRWLESEGIHENVAKNMRIVPRKRGLSRKPLTVESAQLALQAAESHGSPEQALRNRAIVELMLVCALKPGELQVLDVNHVCTVGECATIFVPAGIRRLESVVYVPKGTTQLLRRYIKQRGAAAEDPLFASVSSRSHIQGKRLTSGTIGKIAGEAFERAGIKGAACSESVIRTSIEIAVSLGASEDELRRFGRFRSKMPLYNLAHEGRREENMPQDCIEKILSNQTPRSLAKVATAGEIRAMLNGFGDSELVAVTLEEDGGMRIDEIGTL